MMSLILALGLLAMICAVGLTFWVPAAATVLWILLLETSPDEWLAGLIGGHETIIAVMKAVGLVVAAVMALRYGPRADRYNPAFARCFWLGWCTGCIRGLA